jgi:septal ring factor EnvC (AmiA/AmiB activator)
VRQLVDRAYKGALPDFREKLQRMRTEYSRLKLKTNWSKLRVEPLLKHVKELERRLRSTEFSRESSRLKKGVNQFHSDLVYLRDNVRWLEEILRSEKARLAKHAKPKKD